MIWCGKSPTNNLPRGLPSSLPSWNERMAWLSGTFSGLSAIPAHYLITSSPQASGLFFCQIDKQFLVQFEIPFAVCCSCGTTPPQQNISGLNKHKLHLDLYNNHSAFISIMETQFPIKFQSGLLAQRDSRASDHRGKSCYLGKALFV